MTQNRFRTLSIKFRNEAWRAAVTIIGLAVVSILLAGAAAQALIVQQELDHADFIVMLAGSSTYEERVRHAAELLKRGRASWIVLTNDNQRGGWSEQRQINPLFANLASEQLQNLGVKPEQIEIISPSSAGTYQEALIIREYAERKKLTSILIVTSAYHSRRAFWTFRRVFAGSNIELGIDPVAPGQQTPGPWSWWLHKRGWEIVPAEYIKLVYYRVRF